jgi:all-trans-retinol 13,14-reductase
MTTVQSYKQNPDLSADYDAIVIGSGMGGLTLAAILSQEGKKVLVLERHYTPGGFTHVFKRRDYEWDVGLHYVGDVNRPGTFLHSVFQYITNGKLEWEDMGDNYDRIIFGKTEYRLMKGREPFKAQLKTYFADPKDQEAIDRYVELIRAVNHSGRNFFAEKALPPAISWAAGALMRSKLLKYTRATTLSVLQDLTDNPKLIAVLTGQYGDYGLPPGQSSFAMHAMVARHYLYGAGYPVGGSGAIFDTILPVIEAGGGQVLVNAEVTEILVEKNKATGVKMADGREIFAPLVISSTGIFNTFQKLLPEPVRLANNLPAKVEKLAPSASHVCLYIGFRKTAKELNLPKANYWIYPELYDHDQNIANYLKDPAGPFPVVYISFPAAKDPDFENRYPGRSTVEIITLAPYEWFEKWENDRWKKRGEEYEAFKEKFSRRLLEKLFEFEPQLKGEVDYYELSTPLSTRHFVNYDSGEIYGVAHTPDRFDQRFLRAHTPIQNLFLTGQDIVTAGIGGAASAGMITASAILRKNIVGEIMKGARQPAGGTNT